MCLYIFFILLLNFCVGECGLVGNVAVTLCIYIFFSWVAVGGGVTGGGEGEKTGGGKRGGLGCVTGEELACGCVDVRRVSLVGRMTDKGRVS